MKKVVTFLLLSSLIFTPLVWAREAKSDVWTDAQSEVYGTKAGGMFGRGVMNILTCFVDLLVHVVEGSKAGPPVVGTLTGLGSGLACTALRVTSGAVDVLTFWVPGFNGFPISRSYSNCAGNEGQEAGTQPEAISSGEPAAPPSHAPEDYAKPATPAKHHHNALDYAKK